MAYVDLNPIRAGLAETPEHSEFTSLRQRVLDETPSPSAEPEPLSRVVPELVGFAGRADDDTGLPFSFEDYLELVDWSGRAVHPEKRGRIPDDHPPILDRLGIRPDRLVRYLSRKERGFYLVIGSAASIRQAVSALGRQFLKGVSAANRLFAPQGV